MPRVHTQTAAKDYPAQGIKKGQTYYWWKFRYQGKQRSVTPPTRQQLTQSEYFQGGFDLEDEYESSVACAAYQADVVQALEQARDGFESLAEEQRDKMANMEAANITGGFSYELLEERAEACEEQMGNLEALQNEVEALDEDDVTEEDLEDFDSPEEALAEKARELAEDVNWDWER